MNKVSVIIPCYNEAQSLPLLHTELCKLAESEQQYEWEFLFINDGSRDTTIDELVKLHAIDERGFEPQLWQRGCTLGRF